MSDQERDERLAAIVDAYLEHLEAGAAESDVNSLPEDERAEARASLILLAALWGADVAGAPPLEEDPVAIRFGFDRVNPQVRVAGPRLNLLRRNTGRRSSDVAQQLASMGHNIDRPRLAQLENAPSTTVDIELAAALAAILNAKLTDFEAPAPTPGSRFGADEFTAHALFTSTIAAWSAEHRVDPVALAERSRERLVRLHHRGAQDFTAEEWSEILRELLESDEP